jgi:hypothetical protein
MPALATLPTLLIVESPKKAIKIQNILGGVL